MYISLGFCRLWPQTQLHSTLPLPRPDLQLVLGSSLQLAVLLSYLGCAGWWWGSRVAMPPRLCYLSPFECLCGASVLPPPSHGSRIPSLVCLPFHSALLTLNLLAAVGRDKNPSDREDPRFISPTGSALLWSVLAVDEIRGQPERQKLRQDHCCFLVCIFFSSSC